ncbi:hypothetical protein H0H87_009801, partial [Tephrocybe sp. NHM501043]
MPKRGRQSVQAKAQRISGNHFSSGLQDDCFHDKQLDPDFEPMPAESDSDSEAEHFTKAFAHCGDFDEESDEELSSETDGNGNAESDNDSMRTAP